MTTDEALDWCKIHSCYVEIFTDGSAEIQFAGPFTHRAEFDARINGDDIIEATKRAKAYWCRWLKDRVL